ncbi:MAG: alpha/beta hydrolase [Paracoccaceae bacterium]
MSDTAVADLAYSNGAFIPGAAEYPPRWASEAAAFRASLGKRARLDQRYGGGARQAFDMFLPDITPKGLMVFIHGGYWKAFDRMLWSHLAAGAVARGWACAMPSYTLAPEARIAAMTGEVAQAIMAACAMVPGPVVVTGHSAGGQLAARMGCDDQRVAVARVVPISPLSDLAPLMGTEMNQTLQIDATEAANESPALLPLRPGVQAHVWVGGQERPAFLWQARTLSENWNCGWTVAPGQHHFDVINDLATPDSALMQVCLGGL